ncbi:MAG: type II toxin-antitoxin system RelE/ParE family toxin [Thermomicrobiales bacterium]
MSARNRRLVLTSEARSDLRDAVVFSEQRWGKSQRREYERSIASALDALATFPHLGRSRPDYGRAFYSFPVRQHVIVYQVTETDIIVVRLLHVRRDADSQFETTAE